MNKIKQYSIENEEELFALIEKEGDDWKEYWDEEGRIKYKKAIKDSIIYLIYEHNMLCGFLRCKDDAGFGIYVYDLLVDQNFRGKSYGKLLMEQVCEDFPNDTIYVMSDIDDYYKKLGCKKAGTIFIVTKDGDAK